MDVIGNNIANINTIGFKSSRVSFRDVLSQTMRAATPPQGARGGINPLQVGLGVAIGSIDTNFAPGSTQNTGKVTDLTIDGNGFFQVRSGNEVFYTRAGNFDFDEAGYLVNPGTGMIVQGYALNGTSKGAIGDIKIPVGMQVDAEATSSITLVGNLHAGTATTLTTAAPNAITTASVYDAQGGTHDIVVRFWHTDDANTWSWQAEMPDSNTAAATGTVTFDGNGNLLTPATAPTVTFALPNTINNKTVAPLTMTLDMSAVKQYADPSAVSVGDRNGNTSGQLTGYSIDSTGTIIGVFDNGVNTAIAQMALTNFSNPGGLMHVGNNMFSASLNAGYAQTGTAGTNGLGTITPGMIEMSNVDLSQEFTDMIVTQRGLQANSRVITTSDEILQDIVNLKR
jgi:flagellar hook protein FlgE